MCGAEIQGIDILTSVSPRAIQTEPHYNNLRSKRFSSRLSNPSSGEGTRKTFGDRGEGGERGECHAVVGVGLYKTISREYIFSIILLLFTSIYYFSLFKVGGR